MTIQDIQNILMVSRCGGINKAAGQIPMTQPALSRCIQKVERELQVPLFRRKQGGQISLTKEGEAFLQMGERVLEAYGSFRRTLERGSDPFTIHLGLPPQMGYGSSEKLLRDMYERSPQYRICLHSLPNEQLIAGLKSGDLDCAIFRLEEGEEPDGQLHFEVLRVNAVRLMLRNGSRAGEMAYEVPGSTGKVLDLSCLRGEKFVANLPGSNSRSYSERILNKAGIPLNFMEMANFNNRIDMVRRGEASCLAICDAGRYPDLAFYDLLPEQSHKILSCLACRRGHEKEQYFRLLLSSLKEVYQEL